MRRSSTWQISTLCAARLATSFFLAGASLPAGCSSDAAAIPEPTLSTPGTFVGRVEEGNTGVTLYRVMSVLEINETRKMLIMTQYVGQSADFAEARVVAQRHDLAVAQPRVFMPDDILKSRPWQVVWFRTLTDQDYSNL